MTIHFQLDNLLSKGLHWGYCIPSTCNAEDLTAGLSDYLSRNLANNVTVSVSDSACTANADGSLLSGGDTVA